MPTIAEPKGNRRPRCAYCRSSIRPGDSSGVTLKIGKTEKHELRACRDCAAGLRPIALVAAVTPTQPRRRPILGRDPLAEVENRGYESR